MSKKPAYEELKRRVQELEQLESAFKQTEKENLEHLQFFECMDKINLAIQGTIDLEQMMSDVLDVVLSIFDCDRAWLVYPCDPKAASWRAPLACNKPEYPGALFQGIEIPMDPEMARVFRTVLTSSGPVRFGPGSEYPLPAQAAKQFNEQSQLAMAIYPKGDTPYVFGMHQCSYPRIWSREEESLLQEIGRRLTDGLTSLLMYRNLQKSERRFLAIFNSNPVSIVVTRFRDGRIMDVNNVWEKTTGFSREETIGHTTAELNCWADPDDREPFFSTLRKNGSVRNFEHRLRKKSGAVSHMLMSADLIDYAGEQCIITIGIDITERKQMEETLRINEERYPMAQAISRSGNWEYNLQTTHFWGSDEAKRIFGFDPGQADFTTDEVENCIPERERVHQALVDLIEAGKPYNLEFEIHPRNSAESRFISSIAELKRDKYESPIVVGVIQDITKRRQMEESLQKSEEKYRAVADFTYDWETWLGMDGRFIYVSPSCMRITGYSAQEFINDSSLFIKIVHPDDRAMVERHLKEISSGNIPYLQMEFQIIARNGEEHWIEHICHNIQSPDGKWLGQRASNREITERKEAEKRLKDSEERLTLTLETNRIGIWDWDIKNDQWYASPTYYSMLGYEPRPGPGDRIEWLERVHPDDREYVHDQIRKVLTMNFESYEYEARIRHANGAYRWVNVTGLGAECDNEGIPTRILGTRTDITERKLAEEALRESEEKYRVLIENMMDAVFLTAPDGNVFAANRAACDMMSMSESEIIASGHNGVVDLDDPRLSDALQERTQKGKFRGEINYKRKNGTVFPVEIASFFFRDCKGNDRACVIAHDITDRKKLEEEQLRVQKLESLGLLAGGLAHDFNNILTTILGNVSLARMLVKPDDEIFEFLNDAETASNRAQMLTRQLLTFAKGGAPVKEIASISEIIKESSQFILHGSKSRCEFSIEDGLWNAEVDVGQINQVINNIVLNASQAMPEGGIIRITAENLETETESGLPMKPGRYIRIAITDQGIGIPEKHLPNIFDPYFTTKQKGSGLGLATAYSIIRKHEGLISVESGLGVGTTFYIYIPASDKMISRKEEDFVFHGHGRILVMDDEESIRILAGRILNQLGYEPESARDGVEAVMLYKKARESSRPYDAVILDLTIPGGMGGKDAINELLKIDPDVRAIVSSGYSDDPVLTNFQEYGFKAVVPKPYELRSLSKALYDVLKKEE